MVGGRNEVRLVAIKGKTRNLSLMVGGRIGRIELPFVIGVFGAFLAGAGARRTFDERVCGQFGEVSTKKRREW